MPHEIDGQECWTAHEIAEWAQTSNAHRLISKAGLAPAGTAIAESGQPVKVYRRDEVEARVTPGRRRRQVRTDEEILDELATRYPGRVPTIHEIHQLGVGNPRAGTIRTLRAQQLQDEDAGRP